MRILARELPKETTLIGFAGAPWTVATYMIAGKGSKDQAAAHALKAQDRATFQGLIDRITEALQFMRDHSREPFFAYLPWTPPHGVWGMPADDPSLALYKDKPWTENEKIYAAMVNLIDREVDVVLDVGANCGQYAEAVRRSGWRGCARSITTMP